RLVADQDRAAVVRHAGPSNNRVAAVGTRHDCVVVQEVLGEARRVPGPPGWVGILRDRERLAVLHGHIVAVHLLPFGPGARPRWSGLAARDRAAERPALVGGAGAV